MLQRKVNIPKEQSFFLFGARGTGKSTLLKASLPPAETLYLDLLLRETEEAILRDSRYFRRQVQALSPEIRHVVIDEVQKIPSLLDEVHWLIENDPTPRQYILTGSSARKLKLGAANLLAGRAFVRYLYPFTPVELGSSFHLEDAMRWGMLPRIYSLTSDEDRLDYLSSYGYTYLKEEIIAEQIVRKTEPFRRFLEVAASVNGAILNSKKLADQIGVSSKTVLSFFEILEDTHLGIALDAFHTSVRRQVRQAPKWYLFDVGVARALARMLKVDPLWGTSYGGSLFEQFLVVEWFKRAQYERNDYRFSYLQTKSGLEIDLVIERPGKPLAFIEIKSTDTVTERDFWTLRRLLPDFPEAEGFLVSRDCIEQVSDRIRALPWERALEEI